MVPSSRRIRRRVRRRRLAKRTGACVVASVNIPAEHVDLLAFAERTLAARLSELGM